MASSTDQHRDLSLALRPRLLLYFFAKLNLSKLPRFLYMNQQLTCNKLKKMDQKSNEFLDSSNSPKLKILLVPKQRKERIVCPQTIKLKFLRTFFLFTPQSFLFHLLT